MSINAEAQARLLNAQVVFCKNATIANFSSFAAKREFTTWLRQHNFEIVETTPSTIAYRAPRAGYVEREIRNAR